MRVGRRIARATPACLARCCNGCPLWRKLLQCPNGPTCIGEVPPQRELWICDTVRCEGNPNEPLYSPLNRTVRIDELCWTVTNITAPVPPIGADIVEGTDPVQCVGFSACADEECPQGELFILSRPCTPGGTPVYVCGVNRCNTYNLSPYGCAVVDPSDGYVVPPPNSIIYNADGLVPYENCCDCPAPNGCVHSAGVELSFFCDAGNPNDLYTVDDNNCCCETDESNNPFGRVRVIEADEDRMQTWLNPDQFTERARSYISGETIDSDGNATYERTDYFEPRPQFGQPVPPFSIVTPNWRGYGSGCRLAIDSGIRPFNGYSFFGTVGITPAACPDANISNVAFSYSVSCNEVFINNSYRYTDFLIPGVIRYYEDFSIRVRARLVGSRACGGGCTGRSSRPKTTKAGCATCGQSRTTRVL